MTENETGEMHKRNRSQTFFKIDILKNFAIFKRKRLCLGLISNHHTKHFESENLN